MRGEPGSPRCAPRPRNPPGPSLQQSPHSPSAPRAEASSSSSSSTAPSRGAPRSILGSEGLGAAPAVLGETCPGSPLPGKQPPGSAPPPPPLPFSPPASQPPPGPNAAATGRLPAPGPAAEPPEGKGRPPGDGPVRGAPGPRGHGPEPRSREKGWGRRGEPQHDPCLASGGKTGTAPGRAPRGAFCSPQSPVGCTGGTLTSCCSLTPCAQRAA